MKTVGEVELGSLCRKNSLLRRGMRESGTLLINIEPMMPTKVD